MCKSRINSKERKYNQNYNLQLIKVFSIGILVILKLYSMLIFVRHILTSLSENARQKNHVLGTQLLRELIGNIL